MTINQVNTDEIEVCAADPNEVRTRLEAVVGAPLRVVESYTSQPRWYALYDPDRELAIDLCPTPLPVDYTGPRSYSAELRARLAPDERRPILESWWDALADGTDWHLIWWSDDDPGNGIIREHRSKNGPNMKVER